MDSEINLIEEVGTPAPDNMTPNVMSRLVMVAIPISALDMPLAMNMKAPMAMRLEMSWPSRRSEEPLATLAMASSAMPALAPHLNVRLIRFSSECSVDGYVVAGKDLLKPGHTTSLSTILD